MSKPITIELTKAEVEHILTLIDRAMWYYSDSPDGRRSERIKLKLAQAKSKDK